MKLRKVRKSYLSTEGPSPQQVVAEERILALSLVLQPLLLSDGPRDNQESQISLTVGGQRKILPP